MESARRLPCRKVSRPEQIQRVSWKPVRYMATAVGSILLWTKVVNRAGTTGKNVLTRNEERLRNTCRGLLRLARDPIVDRRLKALTALASVRDVVAVPYLKEAAETDYAPKIEIDGLVRIGGPEARLALEELRKNPDSLTSRMAESGLVRLNRAR